MAEKLTVWLIFTVTVSLIPLGFDYLVGNTKTWKEFWGNGQVLLIGVALSAESIGEIIPLGIKTLAETLIVGGGFLSLLASSLLYPYCSDKTKSANLRISPHVICTILFFVSLITSIFCQIISINSERNTK